MNLLAIDPGTKCGFAHSCGVSGEWFLNVRRDESQGMRLIRLRGKLNDMLRSEPFELLVYEAARHGALKMQGALVVQSEFQSVIKVWCEDKGIEYRGYSPSEIKRHATGKGNSNKQVVLEAARIKWPNVQTDNEADALFLLSLATKELSI